MQKLKNDTLQTFIELFIKKLKNENNARIKNNEKELDIPFIISSLCQSFNNKENEYKDFISDLESYDYGIFIDNCNDFNGILNIRISFFDLWNEENEPNYEYKICFFYDERHYGYCECTPNMPDYREDKHCCGHGCDADFCSFTLHKITHIIEYTWIGDEHDYWEFEDKFYLTDKQLADKKTKEEKTKKIKELKARIEADTKKLAELEKIFYTN